MSRPKSRNSYLFKNTFIFALNTVATKLITFFLIPLYTKEMPPEEYGVVDLLYTIGGFIVPLLSLNITEAVYRFSMDKDRDPSKIFSISMLCCLISAIVGLSVIPVLKNIPGYEQYSCLFYFYLVTFTLSQVLLCTLKGEERLRLFSIGSILHTLVIAIFNIIFLTVFKMGATGYFLALIVSNVVTLLYGFILNFRKINKSIFKIDSTLMKTMLKYSIVLIPTSFMWWITNSSDRIMISSFIGSYANGLYAISYKLPSILTIVASIFNQAWVFSAIREKDSTDNKKYTNKIFRTFFISTCLIAMLAMIVTKPVFSFYIAKEYYDAWKYVPILIVGFIFTVTATFISASYNVYKDSKGFLFSATVGAISNIVLNFILMPFLGVYGAAIATMFSYILVFIYRLLDTKKYLPLKFNKELILITFLTIIIGTLTYINHPIATVVQALIIISSIIFFRRYFIQLIKIVKNKFKKGKA